MGTRVKVKANKVRIEQVAVETAAKLSKRGARNVQARARRRAPKATGALRQGIRVEPRLVGKLTKYAVVSTSPHAGYQEFGTGPIRPKKKNGVLVFKVGGLTVFARHTKGVPATHYMAKTRATITVKDFV